MAYSSLPHEILVEFTRYLCKSDLKNARLTCKSWSFASAEYLFDVVYITPHLANINVFNAIANHIYLGLFVRSIRWDTVFFAPTLTFQSYHKMLWLQAFLSLHRFSDKRFQDPQVESFLSFVRYAKEEEPNPVPRSRVLEMMKRTLQACSGFSFLDVGYREYLAQATFQQDAYQNDNFLNSLTAGFKRLNRLETIKLSERGLWRPEVFVGGSKRKCRVGSPLVRSWSHNYAYPRPLPRKFQFDIPTRSDSSKEYRTLVTALSRARKPLKKLKCLSPLAPISFDSTGPWAQLSDQRPEVFSALEKLEHWLGADAENGTLVTYDDMNLLNQSLRFMTNLKKIRLELPHEYGSQVDPDSWTSYDTISTRDTVWPHLTSFRISDFEVSTKDFLQLLRVQMPRLNSLAIDNIDLTDGHWDGVFEYLRLARFLDVLSLPEDVLLYQNDDGTMVEYFSDESEGKPQRISDYVISRPSTSNLQHPSLGPRQNRVDSWKFYTDIFELCCDGEGDEAPEVPSALDTCMRNDYARYHKECVLVAEREDLEYAMSGE